MSMKAFRAYHVVLSALSAVLFAACADLTVRRLSLSPTCPTTKTEIVFTAEVENKGTKPSGPSVLAFNVGGETEPKMYNIPGLASGATSTVQRKVVLEVAQNYQNTVTVDVNGTVSESREGNNEAKQRYTVAPVPDTSMLTIVEYNEGLASVLRGILLDETAARALNVAAGYYRIGEFRVGHQPEDQAKVLNIAKKYGERAAGQSTLPRRDETWVFSITDTNEWTPIRQAFTTRDYYGHTFRYEIEFDIAANCWKVLSAGLDCATVALSTQTYTTGVLNTCGWSSEPSWTTP